MAFQAETAMEAAAAAVEDLVAEGETVHSALHHHRSMLHHVGSGIWQPHSQASVRHNQDRTCLPCPARGTRDVYPQQSGTTLLRARSVAKSYSPRYRC